MTVAGDTRAPHSDHALAADSGSAHRRSQNVFSCPEATAQRAADRRGNQYLKAPSLKSAEPADLRVTGIPSRLDGYTAVQQQLLDTVEPSTAAVNTHLPDPAPRCRVGATPSTGERAW